MTHLHVIALGGTIASTTSDTGGVSPGMAGEEIAAAAGLDSLVENLEVTFDQVAQVGSANVTLPMLLKTVESARAARTHGARGVVLTQGTDTLEETAFALQLLNDSGIPIVVTGAMRNPTLPGADGPANVRASALVALHPAVADRRCLLVFDDEIHDPVFVRKGHTSSTAAFTSGPVLGALGWVAENQVHLPHLPAPMETLPAPEAVRAEIHRRTEAATQPGSAPLRSDRIVGWDVPMPFVPVMEIGFGETPATVETFKNSPAAGVVVSGVGGGHVPESLVEPLADLAAGLPVVLCSRTGAGATLENTYGYPGAEIELVSCGLLPSGVLDARKARILLTLALLTGTEASQALAPFRLGGQGS